LPRLAAAQLEAAGGERRAGAAGMGSGCLQKRRRQGASCSAPNDIIIAWQPLPGGRRCA
jgi:hypothetical protein